MVQGYDKSQCAIYIPAGTNGSQPVCSEVPWVLQDKYLLLLFLATTTMPTGKRHRDKSQDLENRELSGDEAPGEGGQESVRKRQTSYRKSLLRRAIRAHRKFQLSEADQDICRKTLLVYRKAPLSQRPALLLKATKKVLGLYQAKHGRPASEIIAKGAQEAVHLWMRNRTRNRRRAAKLGTKAYNARNVWLSLNKDKVPDKIEELKNLPEHQGKPLVALYQLAATNLMKGMPEEELADLEIAAAEWNATGPVEEIRKK